MPSIVIVAKYLSPFLVTPIKPVAALGFPRFFWVVSEEDEEKEDEDEPEDDEEEEDEEGEDAEEENSSLSCSVMFG